MTVKVKKANKKDTVQFNFRRKELGNGLSSNNCIAWFCRSTHPFQTFLVLINGWYGWFWPIPFTSLPIIMLLLPLSPLKLDLRIGYWNFAISNHTNHSFGLSVELWRLVPKPTMLLAAYFTTQTLSFSMDCSSYSTIQLVSVPVLNLIILQRRQWKPTTWETSTFCCCQYLSPIYLPHRCPFPIRIWDHLSVSYWPNTGSFWQCYWYQLILICF